MKVEDIIQSLDDLSSNMTALTWLAAPDGHPVYKQLADVVVDFQHAVQPVIKKRSSIFFRKKK
jgi:malate synthase